MSNTDELGYQRKVDFVRFFFTGPFFDTSTDKTLKYLCGNIQHISCSFYSDPKGWSYIICFMKAAHLTGS